MGEGGVGEDLREVATVMSQRHTAVLVQRHPDGLVRLAEDIPRGCVASLHCHVGADLAGQVRCRAVAAPWNLLRLFPAVVACMLALLPVHGADAV